MYVRMRDIGILYSNVPGQDTGDRIRLWGIDQALPEAFWGKGLTCVQSITLVAGCAYPSLKNVGMLFMWKILDPLPNKLKCFG